MPQHSLPTEKEIISQPNDKCNNNALKPSPTNLEKWPMKKLGKYEFSFDQKIGSGLSADAFVGINIENNELVCVKVVDRAIFKTS